MSLASIDLTENSILSGRSNSLFNLRNSMDELTQLVFSFEIIKEEEYDIAISISNINLHSLWDSPQVMFSTLMNDFIQTKDLIITYNGIKMTKEEALELFFVTHCEYCLEKLTKEEKSKQELLCNSCAISFEKDLTYNVD